MKLKNNTLVRNPKIAWQHIQEKAVLVSAKNKKIHVLSGCGGALWEHLKKPKQVDELVELICKEYDTTPEASLKDIQGFLEHLEKEGLIKSSQLKEPKG